ncbi:hypothetical protein ABW20_dc0102831 [Dactylellina cionopaga]|nr:hypothetical protein ABW20_dc0102831 [Dactylellina cionopaga]
MSEEIDLCTQLMSEGLSIPGQSSDFEYEFESESESESESLDDGLSRNLVDSFGDSDDTLYLPGHEESREKDTTEDDLKEYTSSDEAFNDGDTAQFSYTDSDSHERQEMLVRNEFVWQNGQVIRARFLKGASSDIRKKVEKIAKEWEKYANIKFKFVSKEPSHIRISFDLDGGWNSRIGTHALDVTSPKPTMNLAAKPSTPTIALRRRVLHEFGHALGCVHEHSSPAAGIQWDKKAVYSYYKRQGWGIAKVNKNVLKVHDKATVSQFSKFDPYSIMIYPIDCSLTRNGFSVPWNTELSSTDKRFIASLYPKPPKKKVNENKCFQISRPLFAKIRPAKIRPRNLESSCTDPVSRLKSLPPRPKNPCGGPSCGAYCLCEDR